ncbi:hypothetical protein CUMW_186460, partial [Citrus unshiu]
YFVARMELGRIRKWKARNHNRHLETMTIVNGEGNEAAQSNYGFVSFFGEAVRRMKANDARACITREVRKELGMEFTNLPPSEKSKYISQSHRGEKVVVEETKFLTRCALDSGCVLYLEMFCNSIVYGGLRRDRSISPIALWNGCEIKRLIKWIEKKCGYGSIKVTVPLNAGTMKTSAGGSCIHSEQDCTNQSSIRQPTDTVNDPLSNLISQYRAGPFVVARSLEHIDIKLIKYIMNEDLEEGETIVQTDKHCLSRNCMLSLAPTRLINVKIIFVITEMLSTLQKCSEADQCDNWFLPVLIIPQVVSGEGLLQRWVEENVTLTHKNNDLHTYERIWSSDEEQLRLLLLLVQFENNDVRNKVVENASFHFIETQRDALK